ncbi:MAG TPA: hypothetical protein IAB15_00635 [Candidatus Ornithoclostridium faecigallinarum]|nr:hypothetical protein [Candidatus Ornithoclostridium faecigallinarum]
MTHSSTKTKLIAAFTVLAVMLACVFAAVFYTRTGEQNDAPVQSGESASETSSVFPLDYGDPVENTIPSSGAAAISNQEQFYAFINGTAPYDTASYGYLTKDIELRSWPYTDRVIESNQTLDGRGYTITIVNDRDNLDSVYNSEWGGTHIVTGAAQFEQWWGNYGDNSESAKVTLPGGQKAYGVSDLASANYGTIKNLKVVMNGNSADRKDHIVTMREDGHVAMGVLAGYNAGSIINCSVTVNDKYGIVPSPYAVVGQSNIQKVSYQGMTAVGGIAGYNSGNILGSSVSLNADIGIFRSNLGIDTSWPYNSHKRVLSLSTESSSVGGVAGINDGGTISGINAYGGDCKVYNDAWHNQTSYSGLVVGLGNATATNATYKLSGAYGAGVDWTIRPGTINNLTLSWHGNFSFASESYATNATIGNVTDFGTRINNQAWYAVGTYVGIIGGRLGTSATNTTLANYINVYNTNFGSGRWNYNPWALDAFSDGDKSKYTVNINTATGNRAVPLFGYGDGNNNYIKTVNAPTARFDGQIKAGNNTNILTQGATATYIWSGEVVDGVAYAGLLQNINFDGISDLNGHPYNIYKFEGYSSGEKLTSDGSDNIYGADLGDSHLLRLPVYTTGGNIDLEYRYALTCTTLPDAASVDAFFGVNPGSGFGYAYANAVILNADNTVSDKPLAPSGSRVFPSWKTLDGQGHRLTVTSSNVVSGSGAQVRTGGQTFNAYGDFISVNNGTINNVVFRQTGGGERANITVSGNVAYGNVVGVNNGTMNAVYHNNAGGESLRTVVSTSGAYLALGGVAGINLGTINDTASIVWNDFQGSAQTGTFVGGVVGLNMGAGTLRNAKIDGVAPRVMRAKSAPGGEAYLGGILGLGANGTNGGRTVGGLSVTSTLSESPFSDWFFAGKQTLDQTLDQTQTSGAYVGMLAGGVTSDPTETDRPLLGMIVMMPDTQYDLGWFTDSTNTPSLLGRSNGKASTQGYIATSMVGGYSVVAQDASNLYVTAAVSDYNGSVTNNAFAGNFVSTLNKTAYSYDLPTATYYHFNDSVTATITDGGLINVEISPGVFEERLRHNISVPSTAAQLSAIDNSDNPENYAQTIALRYNYTVDLNQSQSDSDTSSSQHALYLFLSGDALGAGLENHPGSYKAVAAGATAAVVTSDLTVSANPNGIVFAAPKTSLNGGGHTITINDNFDGTLNGGATYELGGTTYNVYGELVAVNNASIQNLKIVVSGSRELICDNLVYGAVGVNVGGVGEMGNAVDAKLLNVDVTWGGDVTLQGGGDMYFGGVAGFVGYDGQADDCDLVVNGNVSLTGSYYRANVGAYGYIFGGSDGGVDGTKATWMGDVTMTGADNANVIFGGVAATFNTGNLVGASATFGSTSSWQGYLDGHLYDKAFDLTVNGGNVMAGGVVGHMPGAGNLKNSSALFNVDFDVVQTGAAGDPYNVDVGGVIGQITGGEVTSATVSGLGAIAVTAAAGANIRLGGAVGAADDTPTLTDVRAMLAGGLYNVNTPGDYGWWSGYNEGGVTVNGAVFAVHDGKEYSAENAYGGSPKTTASLGGGYRITDASDRDVDYLAINPNGMTAVNMGPVFAASWNFGSASAVTVAVTDGTITEYTLSASVKVYTNDNKRDEYMLRSALAGVPYAAVTDPSVYGQSKYRYYGWYAGAQTVSLTQSGEFSTQDFNIYLYDTEIGFVWGEGRTLEGNSGEGYKVTVAGAMGSNIAPQEMIWREESGDGTTEVVNSGLYAARGMFLAVNNGVVSNVNVIISNGTSGGGDITIDYATVMETAEAAYPSNMQGVPGGYAGVIFGMFVGVNAGTISGVNALSYDRVTTIKVTDGYEDKDLVVGGMVGAQIGADSSIGGVGTMTFGDGDGIAVTASPGAWLNRISVGGWIGMVSNEDNDTSADGLKVVMKAYSFIDIEAPHNFAALGGIVGDLRGKMTDARIDTEYLSRMLINGTRQGGTQQNGTAALGNLVGVANGATIERAVVKGVGYLYNGIDENSAQQSDSIDLYSGGAIGLASNWAQDTSIAAKTYKRINPSTLDSVYVDFEGYLRAVNGSKVGLITGRLFDGVTVGADGTTVTKKIDATKLRNVVWKVNYYGDAPWASSAYIGNVSTVFNERTELAVYGYAAADVDGYHEGLAKSGMRLWVTNNRYSGETNNEIDAEWTAVGKLKFTVTNITGATDYQSFTAYFNGATGEGGAALEGEDGITSLKTYHDLGTGDKVQASATVDIADRLSSFDRGTVDYSHGVYVIRFIFKEVYIYNQAELMTFITEGRNTVSNKTASTAASALTDNGKDRTGTYAAGQYGLAKTEARYNELKNADIGVLANNIEVNFGATAATMPSHKTLDGQGFTVTLTASGQVTAHQMWSDRDNNSSDSGPAEEYAVGNLVSEQENVRSYVSGGKEAGTTGSDYVTTDQGSSHFDATTLDQMTNTEARVGATIGGLFMGRNLGTIANINFVLPNSVTVFNDNYGSLMVAGIVTAVNAGTIENCSLKLGANATFRAFRDNCSTKGKTNNTDYGEAGARINSVATVGGYAGMMFKYEARSANTAYIRNSTLTLESGSMITVDNEFPTYTWIGMYTSVASYSGGLVGWMLNGGEIYNVILNGEGDVKALASFEGRDNIWNSSYMVGVAGIIVGMNAVYPVFNPIIEVGHTQDNFGYVNGVICNWNGNVEYNARYSSGVGGSPADYYDANHWNYSLGGQMIGVSQIDTIQNVYFMYGVENYATYHRDNWWYGDSVAARAANESFHNKYDYVVSQSIKLLNEHREWDAIYAPVNKNGPNGNSANNSYGDELVPVAHRVNGEVVQGADFTFENYNNYHSADSEANESIFKGVQHVVDNDWGFQLYKTDLDANGQPTYYGDITRSHYHKIVELYPDTQADDNKSHDMVGARTSGRFARISTALEYSYQYTPNNVYIYEVAFGESEKRELDMNDPNTVASMSFETEEITSDIRLDFELYTDENLAQFIWSIEEEWDYTPESGIPDTSTTTDYYDTVNSLEEAMRNNKFDRTMRRDNDSVNIRITYWVGSAVAIAPDLDRYDTVMEYVGEGEDLVVTELTYYDTQPYIYSNSPIVPPVLYYVNAITGERINDTPANINTSLFSYYAIPGGGELAATTPLGAAPTVVGEYFVRLDLGDGPGGGSGDGLRVNYTDRTVMFGVGTDHYDFYTAILPYGVTQGQVESITKTYDGTTASTEGTVFELASSLVGADELKIKGVFEQKDVGVELDFTADSTQKAYVRTVGADGKTITLHTIPVFTAIDGSATNYALATSPPVQSDGVTDNLSKYPGTSGTTVFRGKGVINPYLIDGLLGFQVQVPDPAEDAVSGQTVWQAFNRNDKNYAEYMAGYTYTTAAFADSTLTIGGALKFDTDGTIDEGLLAEDDEIVFAFAFNGNTSASDKGEYTVTLTMTSSNYAFSGTAANAVTNIEVGKLVITEISLDSLAYFVYNMNDIEHTFNGAAPSATAALFGGSLVITDRRGHTLVQGTDYTSVGLSYEIVNSDTEVGEYALRVTITEFISFNYVLDPNTVYTFSPKRTGTAEDASLFIIPKEIRFDSVVKEFDNTGAASSDTTKQNFTEDYAPIAADSDYFFEGEYTTTNGAAGYTTIGEDKDFEFDTTALRFTINGKTRSFNILSVEGNNADGNYYIASPSVECGGITPIEVVIESVRMQYNSSSAVDYTAADTKVVIVRAEGGGEVGIQPEASFDSPRTGTGKTVTVKVTSVKIYGTSYNVLQNSDLSDITATSGDTYSGNYCVEEEQFTNVGEIFQYTIEWEHFNEVLRVNQVDGNTVADFIMFEQSGAAADSLTYKRGYAVEGVIGGRDNDWPNDDKLADIIVFEFTKAPDTLGYAGEYTLSLTIKGVDSNTPDYVWGKGFNKSGDGDAILFNFEVEKQVIKASATASSDPEKVTYNGSAQNIQISASVLDNDGNVLSLDATPDTLHNDDLNSMHTLGSLLPIGDYSTTVEVALEGDDALNYTYNNETPVATFSVLPAELTITSVTKEYDATTAIDTTDNEAVFVMSGNHEKVELDAEYASANASARVNVLFAAREINIGGSNYFVFLDRVGDETNYCASDNATESGDRVALNVGVINKYVIGSGEISSSVYGWVGEEKALREADGSSARFEYRDNGVYSSDDVVVNLSGMRYEFTSTDGNSPVISDGTTLDFNISIEGRVDAGSTPVVLTVGDYEIVVTLDNSNFELAENVRAIGEFTIVQQSVSGGVQDPDNPDVGFVGGNVLITADRYSYIYGEGGFNLPVVDDAKVVLKVTVYDAYSGVAHEFEKAVVGQLLYGADKVETLDGDVLVGDYVVWATAFQDELDNYVISSSAVLPVFVTGTTIPDDAETTEEGAPVGVPHEPIYSILPATAEINSVVKTYDGTTSFTGATTIDVAPQEVAAAITGVYLSPDATHGTDESLTGNGSLDVNIDVHEVEVGGNTYYVISESGVAANYTVNGTVADNKALVSGVAKIYRLVIDSVEMMQVTSEQFGKTYDGSAEVTGVPEMTLTVTLPDVEPLTVTLTPTAAELAFTLDGEEAAEALHAGAYGVAIVPEGMDNFEIAGGAMTVPVNGGAAVYFVAPQLVTINQFAKTYDGTSGRTDKTAVVVDTLVGEESEQFNISFADAAVGLNKTIVVATKTFTSWDGSTLERILNLDGTASDYAVEVATLSGSGYTISPAELTLLGGANKMYDGNTTIDTAATTVFGGFVNGETISPDWHYDSKDAGTRAVRVRVDKSIEYVVGESVYYAVFTMGEDGSLVPGNYGVSADGNIVEVEVEVPPTEEGGEATTETYHYMQFDSAGTISVYQIGAITSVRVNDKDISVEREYDRSTYSVANVDATVTIGGTSVAVAYATGNTLTATTPFGDTLTFNAAFSPTPVQDAGSYTLTISLAANNNYSMSGYTGTFVIVKTDLDSFYIVIPEYGKTYDGTSELPSLDPTGWQAYGQKGGLCFDFTSSVNYGELAAEILDDEGAPFAEGDLPVNVRVGEDGAIGGYAFRLSGVTFENKNYIWDDEYVVNIVTEFDFSGSGTPGARTLYTITPRQLTVNADSLTDKTFDGAFSLSVDTGVEGEYAIVGDANGAVGALAGVYSGVTITPKVLGVTFDSSALNSTTNAANYTIEGGEVTIDMTIDTGNVLTAERALGEYRIGFGGMSGLDFLAGAGADEAAIEAAIEALVATADSGEPLQADVYTSGDPVASLNAALVSLFEVELNTAAVTLEGGKLYFNDFLWSAVPDGMGRKTYALTFSFTGIYGYDEDGFATDIYKFVLKGNTAADGAQYIPSTNASLTSSELAPGQLAAATQTAGTEIATADKLLEFLKKGGTGYLTADIYGFDAAGEGIEFDGALYGNGHTIQLTPSDLEAVPSGGYNAFGALVAVNNGTIRDVNLKLMGCDLAFDESGAVFGAVGVNNRDLVNVSVEVVGTLNIDGAQYAGALTAVNTGTITDCAATVSGAVNMTSTSGETVTQSGTFGGLAGRAGGAMTRVAAYGGGSVFVTVGGAVVGAADGLTIDGVIAAAAWGVKGVAGSGTPAVSGLYVNTTANLGVTADALGDVLSLLAPHEEGFIQYYFTSEGDFTSGGVRHDEFGSAGETNMSGYGVYTDDLTAVIAVEAIAEMGKYIWEGYGISYLTAAGGGSIGTGLNRVVGVFALGSSLANQYDSETATQGVGAFVVALGGFGSTIVAEGTASVKEVIYNGTVQEYTVKLTVDGEEKDVTVSGTAVGYYSKSFVEGVISGGGTTVGDITFDTDNRVAYKIEGGGSSVSDGIALIIHPKTADTVYADKYYDGNADATARLSDSDTAVADEETLGGIHVDESFRATANANEAKYVTVVNAANAVRTVLVDRQGNFVHLVVTDEGEEFVPVTIGEDKAPFGVATPLAGYSVAEIMRAYAMLTDVSDAEGVDTTGYTSAKVFVVTGTWNGAEFGGKLLFAPGSGNLNLTDADWKAQITALAVPQDFDWSTLAKYTIEGTIKPIDLNIGVAISGADQSYNYSIKLPTTKGGAATVGMGFDEAKEKYGLTQAEYEFLCSEAEKIEVDAVSGMFKQLVQEGKLVDNGDGTYSAAAKEYQKFTIATSGGGTDKSGNFIVGASGTLTLRYFEPEIADGKTTYLLGSLDDWRALQNNEGGTADYYTLDYKLSANIDFGGERAMLAWSTADGNMLDFTGTLDGDGKVLSNIFEFNVGDGAKSALIESIGKGGVVKNLTVVDSVFDAFGDNTVTAGIATENHGTIENCTFEGTLAGGSKTAGAATLAGLVANNFGTVKGGTAVADGLIFAAESGTTDAVGIAFNEGETASVESSNAVAAIRAYGGDSGTLGGAVGEDNAGTGNGYVQGLATRDGNVVTDGDTSSDGMLVWRDNASIKSVIDRYVFNSELVSYDGSKLDTDNFRKLIAVLRLFEFVGTADVTHQNASAWGKYATWLAAHALN